MQRAVARKMGQQEFHLIREDAFSLKKDVLGVRRNERYGYQLESCHLR